MNQTVKESLDPKKVFAKEVERIEQLPQTARWRAIKQLLFRVKPEFIPLDKEFIQAIKEERETEMLKETGASKSGGVRKLYSMPQYMYAMLSVVDPDFQRLNEDPNESKKLHLKVARAFPEYCLAKKI
jgi:hypothetical protein